jgi:hypothetical protein
MSEAGDGRDRDRPPDDREGTPDSDAADQRDREAGSETSPQSEREPIRETPQKERSRNYTDEDSRLTDRLAVLISAIVGLVVTGIAYWWAQGFAVFTEELYRVQTTIENRGIGSDWVAGNTDPALDAMIAIIHAADVIMGIAILFMVFLHWATFRRLASRMRQPGETRRADAVATDGGAETESGESGGDDR